MRRRCRHGLCPGKGLNRDDEEEEEQKSSHIGQSIDCNKGWIEKLI